MWAVSKAGWCTSVEGSGYLRCLNNLAANDSYWTVPCMNCHHALRYGAVRCPFGQEVAESVTAEVLLAQSVAIHKAVKCQTRLSAGDLLHVGLLQSSTTYFLLRSFHIWGIRSINNVFGNSWCERRDSFWEGKLLLLSYPSPNFLGFFAILEVGCSSICCQAAVVAAFCQEIYKTVSAFWFND